VNWISWECFGWMKDIGLMRKLRHRRRWRAHRLFAGKQLASRSKSGKIAGKQAQAVNNKYAEKLSAYLGEGE